MSDIRSVNDRDLLVEMLDAAKTLRECLDRMNDGVHDIDLELEFLTVDCQDRIAQLDGTYKYPEE